MIARIQYKGKVYYSYVFAQFQYDYMNKSVVFDSANNHFEIVDYFSQKCYGHRQVGLIDERTPDFVEKHKLTINCGCINNCSGYSWLMENVDLLRDIEMGIAIDEQYNKLAKEMNSTIDPDKWNEVLTKDDAQNMMNHVGDFHDWYLTTITWKSNPVDPEIDNTITLRFESQAAFDTLVQFEGGTILNYCLSPCNRIYLSSIVFDENCIYWVDGDEGLKLRDIEGHEYVKGNKLRWKFVVKDEDDW